MTHLSAKKIIGGLLPPFLFSLLTHIKNHHSLKFFGQTFTGIFPSFQEVLSRFPNAVPYNSKESEFEEKESAAKSLQAFNKAKTNIPPDSTDRYTLLCSLVSSWPSSSLSILDVGGGAGSTLAHLTYSNPSKKINLIVYELPPVVSAGALEFEGVKNIQFIDNLDMVKSSVDIVFLGSSLQYFENYQALVGQIKKLNPKIFVIAYTPTTSAPTFVTAQVNMRRRIIPVKVFNKLELINFFQGLGFILSYQSHLPSAAHFHNFSSPQNESLFLNLVFIEEKK